MAAWRRNKNVNTKLTPEQMCKDRKDATVQMASLKLKKKIRDAAALEAVGHGITRPFPLKRGTEGEQSWWTTVDWWGL